MGVLGADSGNGAKCDRTRSTVLLGGDVLRSIADAGREGGGRVSEGGPKGLVPDMPGEAVWALEGGGGGVAALAGSPLPA